MCTRVAPVLLDLRVVSTVRLSCATLEDDRVRLNVLHSLQQLSSLGVHNLFDSVIVREVLLGTPMFVVLKPMSFEVELIFSTSYIMNLCGMGLVFVAIVLCYANAIGGVATLRRVEIVL